MPKKKNNTLGRELEKEAKIIGKAVQLKPTLKKAARKAHKVPGNLRFAILVTIGVFWAEFLKQAFVAGFATLPIHISTTIATFIAAIAVTIIGLLVLENWPRVRAYFR